MCENRSNRFITFTSTVANSFISSTRRCPSTALFQIFAREHTRWVISGLLVSGPPNSPPIGALDNSTAPLISNLCFTRFKTRFPGRSANHSRSDSFCVGAAVDPPVNLYLGVKSERGFFLHLWQWIICCPGFRSENGRRRRKNGRFLSRIVPLKDPLSSARQ